MLPRVTTALLLLGLLLTPSGSSDTDGGKPKNPKSPSGPQPCSSMAPADCLECCSKAWDAGVETCKEKAEICTKRFLGLFCIFSATDQGILDRCLEKKEEVYQACKGSCVGP